MAHAARFPQVRHDFTKDKLSPRRAERLAAAAEVPAERLAGSSIADLVREDRFGIDPSLFLRRKICGRVVKKDANGNNLPVPFATVTAYDTDVSFTMWSPPGSPWSWCFPLRIHREVVATVVTDECGRFCISFPLFDIDHYLRWRLERTCYLEWLRLPTLRDVLAAHTVVPKLGPVSLDPKVLRAASRLLDTTQQQRLTVAAAGVTPGADNVATEKLLATRRSSGRAVAPLPTGIKATLNDKTRLAFTRLTGVPEKLVGAFDPRRSFGPFLRCSWHLVPEWHTVIDMPDITFEVTQDVDGDGDNEVIYSEGLFDVRWDTGSIADVELVAGPNAIASPDCNNPISGPCGDPSILFAGNYELQQEGNPTNGHDRATGYALYPNVPRVGGLPSGARIEPGAAPFRSGFYLYGCAERPGAARYRVSFHHTPFDGGVSVDGVFGGTAWTLAKLVGGVVQHLTVSDNNGWYPIVPRSDGWTPSGILALVPGGLAPGLYEVSMDFATEAGGVISPIPGSATPKIGIMVDNTAPEGGITQIRWRQPGQAWEVLPLGECPVAARGDKAQPVEFEVTFAVSARHLRDVSLAAAGCGSGASPLVSAVSTGSDNYATAGDTRSVWHWHDGVGDNSSGGVVTFTLGGGAAGGCYGFSLTAFSRAIDPNQPGNNTLNGMWHTDPGVIWSHWPVSVSVQ